MLSEREQPQRRLVRVPDVVGLPLRKALLLIQQSGLRVGAVLYKESYEEKETVLEQKPQRGQMVYARELHQVAAGDLPAQRRDRAQCGARSAVDHPAPVWLD